MELQDNVNFCDACGQNWPKFPTSENAGDREQPCQREYYGLQE